MEQVDKINIQELLGSNKDNRMNWVTMFLLIGNTANPFFYQSIEMLIISFGILGIIWLFKKTDHLILNTNFLIFILFFSTLHILQSFYYEIVPIKTFLGEYLRISFAVLCLFILGERFIDTFIKFVILFALISLIFYFPSILLPGLVDTMVGTFAKYTMAPFVNNYDGIYDIRNNLILFNFNQIEYFRNSGFYWEPGSHGGFLLMALFFNLFFRKTHILSKGNCILLLTILTTLSTTSYIGLIFILFIYNKDLFFKRPILLLLILITLIGLSYILYNKLGFLREKIEKQISYAQKGVPGESRFRSFLIDANETLEHPFIGTGRNIEMRFGNRYFNIDSKLTHRNNGIGVLLSTYGIPFFIVYFGFMFLSLKKILKNFGNAFFGVVLLLVIGFSEDYFFKVFFFALILYCTVNIRSNIQIKPFYKKMSLGLQS